MDELVAYYPWLAFGSEAPAPRPSSTARRRQERRAPPRESGYSLRRLLRA
jgi:hypothetical protein